MSHIGYAWSPSSTLSDPFIANPVATPGADTKYYFKVSDVNACEYIDSVSVKIQADPVFSIDGPGKVCLFDSILLVATGGEIYSSQPADGISDINIPD